MRDDKDKTLETLLQLNGEIFPMDNGFWTKFEAYRVNPVQQVNSLKIFGRQLTNLFPNEVKIMATHILKVGIMTQEEYRKRTIAIAKGDYVPKRGEPKIWFESLKSMAQVLSNENQELLKIIVEKKPSSLKELEAMSGRKRSNLSRTLKTMSRYGIVELEKQKKTIKPKVKATSFKVEFSIDGLA